jgi:hypothetical protein
MTLRLFAYVALNDKVTVTVGPGTRIFNAMLGTVGVLILAGVV